MTNPTTKTASSSAQLASERYIALTTFTRGGEARSTPVWPVAAGDGRIGFVTSTKTWKVKRIQHDPRVRVQASDAKGQVSGRSPALSGHAELLVGDAFESLHQTVKAKYGYQLRIINLLHALPGRRTGHRNDCAVVITLDPA